MGQDRTALPHVIRRGITRPLLLAVSVLGPRLVHAETPSPLIADGPTNPEPTAPVAGPAVTVPPPSVPAVAPPAEAPPLPPTTTSSNSPTSPAATVPTAAYEAPSEPATVQPAPAATPFSEPPAPTPFVQSTPTGSTNEQSATEIRAFQPTLAARPAERDEIADPEQRGKSHPRAWGATLDVGFPDGVILGAAFRPAAVVRLQAGVGTNAVSPGLRAGAVLIPLGMGPSLTLEGGWYFEGNANGIARQVAGSSYSDNRMADRIGYQYANLHLGLDFGRGNSAFFLHGGMSYVHAKLYNANAVFGGQTSDATGATTIYKINGDPSVNAFLPSFKLGFLFYFV